jgi:MFS family permease
VTFVTSQLFRRTAAFANAPVSRITLHAALHKFAWSISGVFSGVFLYRQGLSLAAVFLTFSAVFACRFLGRPLVMALAPRMGLQRLLILGTVLQAAQYPALALVDGIGWALVVFGAALALAGVIYWTSYHAVYTAAGDVTRRGRQVAVRQSLLAIASIAGPALGGVMLTAFGPWVAFGTAAAIEIAAIVPLLGLTEPRFARMTPRGGYAAARNGFLLFVTDGWLNNSAVMAWNLILFTSLRDRFDAFGGAFAAAMLAGSVGGLILGRVIDRGHARRIAAASTVVLSATLFARAFCGTDPAVVVAVAIGTTLVGGLYMPALMTAFYNEAHKAPCPLRFQIAAEGGWDIGGMLAGIGAAALFAVGGSLQAAVLLALPMVALQGYLLDVSYAKRGDAPTAARAAT